MTPWGSLHCSPAALLHLAQPGVYARPGDTDAVTGVELRLWKVPDPHSLPPPPSPLTSEN